MVHQWTSNARQYLDGLKDEMRLAVAEAWEYAVRDRGLLLANDVYTHVADRMYEIADATTPSESEVAAVLASHPEIVNFKTKLEHAEDEQTVGKVIEYLEKYGHGELAKLYDTAKYPFDAHGKRWRFLKRVPATEVHQYDLPFYAAKHHGPFSDVYVV